jgi:hypothetical protein
MNELRDSSTWQLEAGSAVCTRLTYRVVDAHYCSETRIGILRALIERAVALNILEDEICEILL